MEQQCMQSYLHGSLNTWCIASLLFYHGQVATIRGIRNFALISTATTLTIIYPFHLISALTITSTALFLKETIVFKATAQRHQAKSI